MQGYDDITGFKKTTGVSHYRILSKYNTDNVLKKWSVIERIQGISVADAVIPEMPGLSEFQDIPSWNKNISAPTVNSQPATNITQAFNNNNNESRIPEPSMAQSVSLNNKATPTITSRSVTPAPESNFSSLFSQKTPQPAAEKPSNQQRDMQLKTLFERIKSCQ